MRRKKIAVQLLCGILSCAMLAGCGRIPWNIFDLIDMAEQAFQQPIPEPETDSGLTQPLEQGLNAFTLEPYPLAGNGLTPLFDAVEARLGRTYYPMVNVGSFLLEVSPDGQLTGASLTLCEYQGSPAVYQGGFRLQWDAAAHQLEYETLPNLYGNDPTGYQNDNLTMEVVDRNLEQLPMDQLLALFPEGLTIDFTPYGSPEEGTPVVDMSVPPQTLETTRYLAGEYGTAAGELWTLQVSAKDTDQTADSTVWQFCYAPDAPDQWVGHPDQYTQQDIRNGADGLEYTRDWGATWQQMPAEYASLVSDCQDTYTGISRSSWYISPEPGGPAAFLLGSGATLVWTMDGNTWQEYEFHGSNDKLGKMDRRTAIMLPNGMGFVSYGGDWSMGSGGFCELWFTDDGGQTWTQCATLPAEYSVCGAAMLEDGSLMVSVETSSGDNWPAVYVTADSGASWQQLNMPWTYAESAGVSWIYRLDSLTRREDGTLCARFTQEPMGNLAADFSADSLTGYWQFGGIGHIQS